MMLGMTRPMCKACKSAIVNRPNGFCAPCWVKAGKPGAKPKVGGPLKTTVKDELEAMEWVWANERDRTVQEKNLRAMKDGNPRQFFDMMQAMRREKSSEKKWDGLGLCPCCGREADRVEEPEAVEVLIGELLDPTKAETW